MIAPYARPCGGWAVATRDRGLVIVSRLSARTLLVSGGPTHRWSVAIDATHLDGEWPVEDFRLFLCSIAGVSPC